jgi:hypothetical protein
VKLLGHVAGNRMCPACPEDWPRPDWCPADVPCSTEGLGWVHAERTEHVDGQPGLDWADTECDGCGATMEDTLPCVGHGKLKVDLGRWAWRVDTSELTVWRAPNVDVLPSGEKSRKSSPGGTQG